MYLLPVNLAFTSGKVSQSDAGGRPSLMAFDSPDLGHWSVLRDFLTQLRGTDISKNKERDMILTYFIVSCKRKKTKRRYRLKRQKWAAVVTNHKWIPIKLWRNNIKGQGDIRRLHSQSPYLSVLFAEIPNESHPPTTTGKPNTLGGTNYIFTIYYTMYKLTIKIIWRNNNNTY